MDAKLQDLQARKEQAYNAGSPRSVERQHEKGKLLARERITTLLDPESFHELDLLARHRAHAAGLEERPYTDGVITGWGTIDGRKVFVYSQDFTVFGGALGEVFAEKIHKLMDLALKVGAPVIGLNDGAGARIQEGVVSLASYGGIFHRNVQASGVIPQISVILGPCAGGAVYSPAMTDFIFMVRETSHMFITGPDVVKTVTGEEVTLEELGGAMSHASKSGVATFVSADEQSCLQDVRYLLSFLPQNNLSEVPASDATDDPMRKCESLRTILPASPNQPYDMKKVIAEVMDDGEFFEYFPHWAKSIVCGFSRLNGQAVGVVGNQPMVLAGVLDIESSEKAARFVQHSNRHIRRRSRIPSWSRPGIRRHYSPRRKVAVRILRKHRASHSSNHTQGLRRCIRRDELKVHWCRPCLCMANSRTCSYGPARRSRNCVPSRIATSSRPCCPTR
jgi:acetyl-CoA carboxylase carboxyltransferase component